MYTKYDCYIDKNAIIIADSSHQVRKYINETKRRADLIPADKKDKLIFKSENGHDLAAVNQLHSALKKEWRKRHGISTRHLQGYIDWLVYLRKLKSVTSGKDRKHEAYIDLMGEKIPFINEEIVRLPFPVDIKEAYGPNYHGIYEI